MNIIEHLDDRARRFPLEDGGQNRIKKTIILVIHQTAKNMTLFVISTINNLPLCLSDVQI